MKMAVHCCMSLAGRCRCMSIAEWNGSLSRLRLKLMVLALCHPSSVGPHNGFSIILAGCVLQMT